MKNKHFFYLLIFLCCYPHINYALTLNEIINSVQKNYPEIVKAIAQWEEQKNLTQSRLGAFDLNIIAENSKSKGYPEIHYQSLGIETQIYMTPIKLKATFDQANGLFPTYQGEYNTGSEGRSKIGLTIPILRNLIIDSARLNYQIQNLNELSAEQQLRIHKMEAFAQAALNYWIWRMYTENDNIIRQLVELAHHNNKLIQKRVQIGDAPEIELVENQKIIAQRNAKKAITEQLKQQSSRLLSLFYRDEKQNPIIPAENIMLPSWIEEAPQNAPQYSFLREKILDLPELKKIRYEIENAQLQYKYFYWNQFPQLDIKIENSQYLGLLPTGRTDPYEQYLGVSLTIPLFNLQARYQTRSLKHRIQAKKQELKLKEDLLNVKSKNLEIEIEKIFEQLKHALIELKASQALVEAERKKFILGGSSLFLINVRESEAAQAHIKVNELILKWKQKDMEIKLLYNEWIEKF